MELFEKSSNFADVDTCWILGCQTWCQLVFNVYTALRTRCQAKFREAVLKDMAYAEARSFSRAGYEWELFAKKNAVKWFIMFHLMQVNIVQRIVVKPKWKR